MEKIKRLNESFNNNQDRFEPFIRHIRFPHFKNIDPETILTFKSPITAIVGPNGSNKSSVLRALASCPHYINLGEHWFATAIDPILETGGRPRYIFGYKNIKTQKIVEVLQERIKKPGNPDYFEPSRPKISDGMEPMPDIPGNISDEEKDDYFKSQGRVGTRWKGITKKVELLDFRREISAFDKVLHNSEAYKKFRKKPAKEFLRSRSRLLKDSITNNLTSKIHYGKEKIFSNNLLSAETVEIVSKIIGKKYNSIRVIEHDFFDNKSVTLIIESPTLKYSEAFAGSGEFAVIMLVIKILKCSENSLIILDEPEVSLHPEAQEKLLDFLVKESQKKGHQIIIGTHSLFLIKKLSSGSIILLSEDTASGLITAKHEIMPHEAFFHLGVNYSDKIRIIVEDKLAAEIIRKALRAMGEAACERFEIRPIPGGGEAILTKIVPATFSSADNNIIFFLDGDQKPKKQLDEPYNINSSNIIGNIKNILKSEKIELNRNGGCASQEVHTQNLIHLYSYAIQRIFYLPEPTPENFIWKHSDTEKYSNLSELPIKERFAMIAKIEYGLPDFEDADSNTIFSSQKRLLATISNTHAEIEAIKNILRKFIS